MNKVSSVIKVEHIPTGITVSMRDESRTQEHGRQRRPRRPHPHLQLPAERRHQPQNRGTDHRINQDVFDPPRILAGEFDEFLKELSDREMQLRLEAL